MEEVAGSFASIMVDYHTSQFLSVAGLAAFKMQENAQPGTKLLSLPLL